MKNFTITRIRMLLVAIFWTILFVVLSITSTNYFQVLNVVGFLFLVIVPGILTVIVLRIKKLEFWGYIGLTVGFSLLELMVIGLIGNTLLPYVGVARPLDGPIILGEVSILVGFLLAINWRRWEGIKISFKHFVFFDNIRDYILAFSPAVFVVMSIAGAIRLNNGASGTLTLVMLVGIAVYSAILIRYSEKVDPNVIPVALFFISLSLLFMTSLRGWYTTGHDVQREYRVFELAKNNGIWSIASFRDAYNACLSITILPVMFFNTLKFTGPYVYKIFFQLLFAVVPGILYLTVRRYLTATLALLSTFYFISFPAFFGDMPMLNRQEIALLFLSLMSYILFEKNLSVYIKRVVFVVFGLGMVISHYTTTYTVIAMLLFLVCARALMRLTSRYFQKRKLFPDSSIEYFNSKALQSKNNITVWMVVILIIASFLWSSVLTDTSSNSFSRVVIETIKTIQSNTKEDAKSGDVLYGLFSWHKLDKAAELVAYNKDVVLPARTQASAEIYYDPSSYEKYPLAVISDDIMPLTPFGKMLSSLGLDVTSFNYIFRQVSAKLLQFFVLIGFVFMLFRKKFINNLLDTEYVLLAGGGLILIFSQLVLPTLAIEYGILRAFQQSLFFVGIFIVIGILAIMRGMKDSIRIVIASTFTLVFFLSSVGVFTQLLGGYGPQLHLNNNGTYYDVYYLHKTEIAGISWLADTAIKNKASEEFQSEVQSDRYSFNRVKYIGNIDVLSDIHPGLIRKNSYVYLGFTNVKKQQATLNHNSNLITYTYPMQFLDDNKNLIYNNGGSKIYR